MTGLSEFEKSTLGQISLLLEEQALSEVAWVYQYNAHLSPRATVTLPRYWGSPYHRPCSRSEMWLQLTPPCRDFSQWCPCRGGHTVLHRLWASRAWLLSVSRWDWQLRQANTNEGGWKPFCRIAPSAALQPASQFYGQFPVTPLWKYGPVPRPGQL